MYTARTLNIRADRAFAAMAGTLLLLAGMTWAPPAYGASPQEHGAASTAPAKEHTMNDTTQTALATFAGGCFWCMEHPFDRIEGVLSTTSGYTGGHTPDPTYKEVSSGVTGHAEAMQIEYDPARVSYETLLYVFWRNVDPLDDGGQFCDRGGQYTSAVYYHDEEQKALAEVSKKELEASGVLPGPIVTPIVAASTFYPAEDYHQNYYSRNPIRYRFYRYGCGRDKRLEELWGDEAGGTEPPAAP